MEEEDIMLRRPQITWENARRMMNDSQFNLFFSLDAFDVDKCLQMVLINHIL